MTFTRKSLGTFLNISGACLVLIGSIMTIGGVARAVSNSSTITVVLSDGTSTGSVGLEVIAQDTSQLALLKRYALTVRYRGSSQLIVFVDGQQYTVLTVPSQSDWQTVDLEISLPGTTNSIVTIIASNSSTTETATVTIPVQKVVNSDLPDRPIDTPTRNDPIIIPGSVIANNSDSAIYYDGDTGKIESDEAKNEVIPPRIPAEVTGFLPVCELDSPCNRSFWRIWIWGVILVVAGLVILAASRDPRDRDKAKGNKRNA